MTRIDLNSKTRNFTSNVGAAGYVRRQIHFLPTHGFCSLATSTNLRRSLQRRSQNKIVSMLRTVSCNGIRSINISPEVEVCLRSIQAKLYPLGICSLFSHSNLAHANQTHDWRIYADFTQILIQRS